MSGGHFDTCSYRDLLDIASVVDVDGDPVFADFLRDVEKLIHDYDWYRSGDSGKDTWHESRWAFIKKWNGSSFEELAEASIKERVERMCKEVFTSEDIRRWEW